MFFCTGVGRKNVVLVEELRVRGSWNTREYICIMTINLFLVVIIEKVSKDS